MEVPTENKLSEIEITKKNENILPKGKSTLANRTAHPAKIELMNDLKKYFTELNNYSDLEAEENLIYGMEISMLSEKCKIKVGLIYTTDEDSFIFLNQKSKKTNPLKIVLVKITDISKGKISGNFKRFKTDPRLKNLSENCCLTVHYDNNFKYYDFVFKSEHHLNIFLKAILIFLEKTIKEMNTFNTDLLTLKKIWKEYDPDHNKHLNITQFSQFLENINFKWKKKNHEQIFKEIDTKNEGKISFKDFISFYELIVTGEEFREVFQKYSSDDHKKYITVRGIIDFMEKEQHIKLKTNEVIALMTKYSKKAKKLVEKMKIRNGNEIGELPTTFVIFDQSHNNSNKKILLEEGGQTIINLNMGSSNTVGNFLNNTQKFLEIGGHEIEQVESMLNIYENHSFGKNFYYNEGNEEIIRKTNENAFSLNFREFVNLLIDKNSNSVYNQDYFSIYQNMNLPLYDYYIYSSHNTYLDGNQINSNCNIEMYYCAIKNGCRLLELDCWDGRNGEPDEPIITHWYFMVGELNFKEVLINIKQWAFKKSEFPVILSVENHCSPPAQLKMDMYFREVLGMENLFIVDPDNPPLNYPSPNDLKHKYIIKCKRKRIFGNFDKFDFNKNNIANLYRQSSVSGSNNKNYSDTEKVTTNYKEIVLANFNSGNSAINFNENYCNAKMENVLNVLPLTKLKNYDEASHGSPAQKDKDSSHHNSSPQNIKENFNSNEEGVGTNNNPPNSNLNTGKIKSIAIRIVPENEVIHEEECNTHSEENIDIDECEPHIDKQTIHYNNIDNPNNDVNKFINNFKNENDIDEINLRFDSEGAFDKEKLSRLCAGREYKTKSNLENNLEEKDRENINPVYNEGDKNLKKIKISIKPNENLNSTQKKNPEYNSELVKKIVENEPILKEVSPAKCKISLAQNNTSPKRHKGSLHNLNQTGSLKKHTNLFYNSEGNEFNFNGHTLTFNNIPNPSEKEIYKASINEDNNLPKQLFPKIEEGKELKLKNFNVNYFNEPEEPKINTINSHQIPSQSFNQVVSINKSNMRKKSNASYESLENLEKNEIQSIFSNNSNVLFKKLKAKYSIEESEENANACASSINQNNNGQKSSIINKIQEIKDKDKKNLKKPVIKTIEILQKIVGMVGVKYKREDFEKTNYLPWECISISEPDFIKYMQNIELKLRIIKLCQGSFLKIYPDILRTNSSNHDPIMCWASGVQVAALNLQKTDDDWVLINKIFFKLNGGSKSGYILKPEILRNPNCDDVIRKIFWKPIYKIKFKVLSGFHLHLCFPKGPKISGIFVEVSLRSPYGDKESQKNEVKLTTDTISNNFLHPVWQSNSVQFEIYDPELSFIIVKIYSKKKKLLLARSVIPVKILNLGYRVLDLYDKLCSKYESSFLIVKSNRILL